MAAARSEPLPRPSSEEGFTLIELVLAVVLVAVVTAALSQAFILVVNTQDVVQNRYNESHDAQNASAYFAADVQGMTSIGSSACSSSGSLQHVLTLNQSESSSARVSYFMTTLGTFREIRRHVCDDSGSLVDDHVVASFTDTTAPVPLCDGAACDPIATPRPRRVTLPIRERSTASAASDYSYDLVGTRRAHSGGTTNQPPPASSIVFLAVGVGSKQVKLNGNACLQVNGDMFVASTASDAIDNGADGNAGCSGYLSGVHIGVPGKQIKIQSPGACKGCSASNTSPFPTQSVLTTPLDPFALLPRPIRSDFPASKIFTSGGYQGPGIYTFRLNVGRNSRLTMEPGVHVFERGLNVPGGAVVEGTGVFIFNGCEAGAPSCPADNTVNIQGDRVDLTPMSTGPYAGIQIWQPIENDNPVDVQGGVICTFTGGGVYAPGSIKGLSLGGGGTEFRAKFVIGTNIEMNGTPLAIINP